MTRLIVDGLLAEHQSERRLVNPRFEFAAELRARAQAVGVDDSPTRIERTSPSASGTVSASTSSPSATTVSGCGITTWPPRMIATIAQSGGSRSS